MLKKLLKLLQPFKGAFAIMLGLVLLRQALELAQPYFWGKLVDSFFSPDLGTIKGLIIVMGVLMVADLVIDYIHNIYENRKFVFKVNKVVDMHTVKRALGLSLGQITGANSGFRQKVATQGANAVLGATQMTVYDILPSVTMIVLAFAFISINSPLLAVIVFATIAVSMSIVIPANLYMAKRIRNYREVDDKVGQQYSEVLRSLQLVMLSGQESETHGRLEKDYAAVTKLAENMWMKYFLTAGLSQDIFLIIGRLALIVTGAHLVLAGSITAGSLVATLSWASSIFGRSNLIARLIRRLTVMAVDIVRYFEIVDLEPSLPAPKNPIRLENMRGEIRIEDVSFSYPEGKDKNALHDVSFDIKAGELCAIVGHSGAGKSTLINLILRGFDPQSGRVTIDGVDLRELDIRPYRRSIGYVEQQVKLWDDTLRYNLLFGIDDPSKIGEAELRAVAEKSRINAFFDRLPEGFDTKIGENGVKLSGGERQRVAIARALLRDPRLLILDEATNSLDTINDAYIQQAMRDALKGRTGIVIAHRLSTIRHADKIVVMDKGRVAGIGTHDELLKTCQQYKDLVEKEGQVIVA
jgi:ATP-binding cassette, subfamily B, bacterial MsbA